MKNKYKLYTTIIIYALFISIFFIFDDPHRGNFLDDPGGFIMTENMVRESVNSYRIVYLILWLVLLIISIRLYWSIKGKQIDIFACIIGVGVVLTLLTYNLEQFSLTTLDKANYSKMIYTYLSTTPVYSTAILTITLLIYPFFFNTIGKSNLKF